MAIDKRNKKYHAKIGVQEADRLDVEVTTNVYDRNLYEENDSNNEEYNVTQRNSIE